MKVTQFSFFRIFKLACFSLFTVIAFFVILEFSLRAANKAARINNYYFLESESIGLDIEDNQLFWKMKPNFTIEWQGVNIRTNSLGLRDDEVDTKKERRFRILSLGESTTFGAKVNFPDIYSEVLERRLNQEHSDYIFEVINAGVSAYTSFQSLVYLKTAGLKLSPDMVLIYHEYNDSLPTTLRNRGNVIGLPAFTDRQLYTLRNCFGGLLFYLNRSQVYKLIRKYITRLRIFLLKGTARAPVKGASSFESCIQQAEFRVPSKDKERIFNEFLQIAKERNFRMVFIHPVYRFSELHTCFLTEFVKQKNLALSEPFSAFQNSGYSREELFYDNMHPTALGHRIIAECIFKQIEPLIKKEVEDVK